MSVLDDAVRRIADADRLEPRVGIVLGSGLGGLADELDDRVEIPYGEIPGWPASTAVGHAGVLVLGTVDGVPVAVLKGRAHLYEGVSADRAVFGVRVLGRLGVRRARRDERRGGDRRGLRPGMLVLISDHVNLLGTSPLVGPNDDALGPRFPDMSDAYDPSCARGLARSRPRSASSSRRASTARGSGRSSRRRPRSASCGRSAATSPGMSTVPEVIAARHMGVRCLGISVVTNMAAGVVEGKLDHEAVLAVGA